MKIEQRTVTDIASLKAAIAPLQAIAPQWVLVFGSVSFMTSPEMATTLRAAFPDVALQGCSTAGEIAGHVVDDDGCVITAIHFDSVSIRRAATPLAGMGDSRAAGIRIGEQLKADELRAVVVLAPGVAINGSALVDGIASVIGDSIPLTGGLAGDGSAFQRTWTLSADGISDDGIVAIGLCGDRLRFGHGSFGGWESFGPARKVTRHEGNVLYELDGVPALEIYKRYLGDYASYLPSSGLLFPFAMLGQNHDEVGLIRTILGVSEADGSLTLAGEIQADGYLKLMHASTDSLIDGAETAAETVAAMNDGVRNGLAILVSCVGRKLVMGERVDEEVEAVGDILGPDVVLTGFYSYGEISPMASGTSCKLHNQTMTIAFIAES